jgi:hypothetical protein
MKWCVVLAAEVYISLLALIPTVVICTARLGIASDTGLYDIVGMPLSGVAKHKDWNSASGVHRFWSWIIPVSCRCLWERASYTRNRSIAFPDGA